MTGKWSETARIANYNENKYFAVLYSGSQAVYLLYGLAGNGIFV